MIDRQTANDVGIPSYIPQYTNTSIYFSSKLTCHQANKPINVLNTISMLSECRHRSVPVSCVLCATVVRCATRSFLPSFLPPLVFVRSSGTHRRLYSNKYVSYHTHAFDPIACFFDAPSSVSHRSGSENEEEHLPPYYRRTTVNAMWMAGCSTPPSLPSPPVTPPRLPRLHASTLPPFISSQGSRLHPVSRA